MDGRHRLCPPGLAAGPLPHRRRRRSDRRRVRDPAPPRRGPATGIYDGQSLRGCDGDAAAQSFDRPDRPPGQVLSLTCDMTEGASGGPWLTGPDATRGRGQVVGVVSGGDDTTLVSPRFDDTARQVYEAADSAAQLPDQPPTPDPALARTAPRGGTS